MFPKIVIFLAILKHCVCNGEHISFDRDHIIVEFNPAFSKTDMSYGESELIQFLEVVSTKFSKIIIGGIYYDTTYTMTLLPKAVADFNNLQQNGKLSGDMDTVKTMEVIMMYDLILPIDSSKDRLDITLNAANEANKIFPGTVKTIFFYSFPLSFENVDDVVKALTYSRETIQNSSFPYKFWAMFHHENCATPQGLLPNYMKTVLGHVDQAVFDLWTFDEDLAEGVDESVAKITRTFSRCKARINNWNDSVGVGFRTRWHDTSSSGVQNIPSLVTFWKRMNWWSVSTNTSVILLEAFDIPGKKPPENSNGWWRYKEGTSYEFQEKSQLQEGVVKNEPKAIVSTTQTTTVSTTLKPEEISLPPPPPHPPGVNWVMIVGLGAGFLILLISLLSAGLFCVYKKIISHVENYCLTKEEIRDFFDGSSLSFSPNEDYQVTQEVAGNAYDKKLELSKSCFEIDEKRVLGQGEFGYVYPCIIFKDNTQTPAGAKVSKQFCPTATLKSLLMEIKVMSYLGKHGHIVEILGAHTEEIAKGKVYIFLELCSEGSLDKYLKKHRKQYEQVLERHRRKSELSLEESSPYLRLSYTEGVDNSGCDASEKLEPCESDLVRWSIEIANGLEYLASKRVVHADVATRNVLLDVNKKAKIADFGLSRRMYNYANYVKQHKEPLPWRYMSPESLRRLEFNEKSDVWAYGVTLWEIYTLGDVPYPGVSFTAEFSKKLEDGLRLKQPQYAPNDMYSTMTQCWQSEPSLRPTFTEVIQLLRPNS